MIQRSWQRSYIVVHSMLTHRFMLTGLMAHYKPRMEEQHMYKVAKYEDLIADLRDDGTMPRFCVSTRGLISKSAYHALKQLGLKETTIKRAMRSLCEATEKASYLSILHP